MNPYAAEPVSIPVRIALAPAPVSRDTAVLRLEAEPGHAHADGHHCPPCAMQRDIRARLFELLVQARTGARPHFSEVLVLVADNATRDEANAALTTGPARALRDHTVAKSFHLAVH